ncbi:MAG TPA: hypothetical protein VJ464_06070 [Blastocatellia bacterium]|nr:hypothetical protein [Blastocatellia bacterium]
MESTNTPKQAVPISTAILLVICVDAFVVVAASVLDRASQFNQSGLFLLGAILVTAFLASRRQLGNQMALALNDLTAIGAAVMIAPAAAVLAVATNHLLFCGSKKEGKAGKAWILYGIGGSIVAMNVASHATASLFASFGMAQEELTGAAAIAAMAVCAVGYFSLSTLLFAVYEAFSLDKSILAALKGYVLWNTMHLLFTMPASLPVYLMRQWNYDASRHPHKSRIGEVLVSRGLITQANLQAALDMQSQMADRAKRLGEILVEMGVVEERQVLVALAESNSMAPAFR